MNEGDNMTETRGSLEEDKTFWGRIKPFFCPCILPKSGSSHQTEIISISKARQTNQSNSSNRYNFGFEEDNTNRLSNFRRTTDIMNESSSTKRQGLLDKKGKQTRPEQRQTINLDFITRESVKIKNNSDCSVFNYAQNTLISIGINESHLLVRINRVNLTPNLNILKKELIQSPKRKKDKKDMSFISPQFEKFWNQRYLLFEKFDEGVKLDQGSWESIPPQQVSQFIASKCCGAKCILDGFAGVGGTTVRLANVSSCVKLIANDFNQKKTSLLLNNSKVYQVDERVEISEQDFLQVEMKNIDIVFVKPPVGKQQMQTSSKSLSIVDFEPTLNKVIMKSLKLATDVLILLPPNISIDALCSCINKCASQVKKMKNSCSIILDKIYFQDQFKYILVSLGNLVSKQIKLNDQLQYIYNRFKKEGQKYFKHKKIIKKIRQQYGMLQLLNLLKISEKLSKQAIEKNGNIDQNLPISCFYQLIQERNLISKPKLEKLIDDQNSETKKRASLQTSNENSKLYDENNIKEIMEQQKVQEAGLPFRQSEQTQSDYSHYSYLSGLQKSSNPTSRLMRLPSDSFSSVIIKRTINGSKQKRDISPNQRGSPVTPSRKNPKNRVSQILLSNSKITDNQPKKKRLKSYDFQTIYHTFINITIISLIFDQLSLLFGNSTY